MAAQQDVCRDDRANDRGRHEQGDAREEPRGESHVRRRRAAGGGAGSRNRYPTARTVSIQSPAAPSLARNRCRSEEHTSELQSQSNLVCRLLLEKKKT